MSRYSKNIIRVKELTEEPGAIAVITDFKDRTDPKYIGPGTWSVIHTLAYKARNIEKQRDFIYFMKEICESFPCVVCKGHCKEYINNHPIEDYLGILVDINGEKFMIGMFVWAWKFHNAVNVRIKKPIMSWDTAYNLYSEQEPLVCSKSCLEADLQHQKEDNNNNKKNIIKIPQIKSKQTQPFKMLSLDRK